MEVNEHALIELLNHAYLKMKDDLNKALQENKILSKELLECQSSTKDTQKTQKKSTSTAPKGAEKETS